MAVCHLARQLRDHLLRRSISLVWAVVWGVVLPGRAPTSTSRRVTGRVAEQATAAAAPAWRRRGWRCRGARWCGGWRRSSSCISAMAGRCGPSCPGVPQFLLHNYNLNLKNSALVRLPGVHRRRGRGRAGRLRQRLAAAPHRKPDQPRGATWWCSAWPARRLLHPHLFTGNASIAAICLAGTFFFAELTIGPMWPSRWTSHRPMPAPPAG